MSYKQIKRLSDCRAKYNFYARVNGEQKRKRVTCLPVHAKEIHRTWLERVESEACGDFRLFEKLDEYLEFAKPRHSKKYHIAMMNHIKQLKIFLKKDMRLSEFRRHLMKDFLQWRRTHSQLERVTELSPATVKHCLASISGFFSYCIDKEYWIQVNPCSSLKIKIDNFRRINLTGEQIQELLVKAREDGVVYTVVLLAIGCGLRRGEIMSLKWDDIDFEKSMILLSGSITKNGKERAVTIPYIVLDHLRELKKKNPFSQRVMEVWNSMSKAETELKKFFDKLSFRILSNGLKLRLHDLRHQYGQSLLDAGMELEDIQKLMGHSSVRITQERYVHFNNRKLQDKVDRLSDVLRIDDAV